MTAVIYCLKDPTTNAVRYVGKANNLPARIRCHKWEAQSSDLQTHKVRWLRTLDTDPIVEILETITEPSQWQERERYWINHLRNSGANLTNIADGGQTSPVEGIGHTEEAKAKMRAASIRNGSRPPSRAGQPVSESAREKMRQAALRRGAKPPPRGGWNKGKKMSPEAVEKNRQGHIGKPWSAARRAAQQSKVCQKASEKKVR